MLYWVTWSVVYYLICCCWFPVYTVHYVILNSLYFNANEIQFVVLLVLHGD
jgi:hypothetical protein